MPPRPKAHVFEFTGMLACGECGSMITAEEKRKISSNGEALRYIYYHGTKEKNPTCGQGSVRDDRLRDQIIEKITTLKMPPEFHEFAMKWFRKENHNEFEVQNVALDVQRKEYKSVLAKLERLLDMRAGDEIDEEEYKASKELALIEKKRLETFLEDRAEEIGNWVERGDEMLAFIKDAVQKFENSGLDIRRDILATLGSKLLLKDGKLEISMQESPFPYGIRKQRGPRHSRYYRNARKRCKR